MDLLIGIAPYDYSAGAGLGGTAEFRGGAQIGNHLLVGSGLSIMTLNINEVGITIPLEVGYRFKNSMIDYVSSVGYSYLNDRRTNSSVDGATFAVDAYLRPTNYP